MLLNSAGNYNPFELLHTTLAEIQKTVKELTEKTSQALSTTAPEPERLLTRKQLAEFLGISEVSVWARMNDGSIKSYKIGNLVRFKQSEILANLHQIQRKK